MGPLNQTNRQGGVQDVVGTRRLELLTSTVPKAPVPVLVSRADQRTRISSVDEVRDRAFYDLERLPVPRAASASRFLRSSS